MTTVRGMGTLAAKYWWVLLVRGIMLVLLGIAMFAWPKATLLVFVVLFAAYLFVDGIMAIFQGFSERKDRAAVRLVLRLGRAGHRVRHRRAGLAGHDRQGADVPHRDLGDPGRRSPASPAGFRLEAGARAPAGAGSWPGASWPLVFGIALIANPAAGILSILWLVAIWAIMGGIVIIIASFFVKKVGNAIVNSPTCEPNSSPGAGERTERRLRGPGSDGRRSAVDRVTRSGPAFGHSRCLPAFRSPCPRSGYCWSRPPDRHHVLARRPRRPGRSPPWSSGCRLPRGPDLDAVHRCGHLHRTGVLLLRRRIAGGRARAVRAARSDRCGPRPHC